jgi:hypothetical protein
VDRQIREVRRYTACRTAGTLRYGDKGSAAEAVRPAVDAHLPRARHTNKEYVYLIVHVLADPFSLIELDEVDVEIAALLQAPDNACPLLGGGQYLCNFCAIFRGHPLLPGNRIPVVFVDLGAQFWVQTNIGI